MFLVLSSESNLLKGQIPSELGKINNLRRLSLYNNDISGIIPKTLKELNLLESLDLEMNRLSGEFDIEDFQRAAPSLERLRLSFNELSGSISEAVGQFVNLKEFWMAGNVLTGTIPQQLQALTKLGKASSKRCALFLAMLHSFSNLYFFV